MNVLHILDRSMPNLSGYSVRAKYIIDFQKQLGLFPIIVTSPKYDIVPDCQEINGIKYYRSVVNKSLVNKLLMKLPFLRENLQMNVFEKKIEQVVKKEKVDIIHAHSPSLCGLPGLKIAKEQNIPFVYEIRAFWEDAAVDLGRFKENSFKYKVSRYMENKLFRKADNVVAICEGIKNEILSRKLRNSVEVVKNGVDTDIFIPLKKNDSLVKKYNLENKTVVGYIGTFFKFEGIDCLIKSAAKILKQNNSVVFIIVGGGVEDKNVRELAKELKILDRGVIFTGKVSHSEVLAYYSIFDILVYPRISKRITELVTPLKPLEAMSMEKAVVGSDVGGVKELISNNRTGLLFKAEDIGDLTKKILDLLNNYKKRVFLGQNARLDVIENRNWVKIISESLGIYEKILKEFKK